MTSKFYEIRVLKNDQTIRTLATDLDLEQVDLSALRLRKVLGAAVRSDRGEQEPWRYVLELREHGRHDIVMTFVDSTVDQP